MALFDTLNQFGESLRSVNQSLGITVDRMEKESMKRVHNFEMLNKDLVITNKGLTEIGDSFDENFNPGINTAYDTMADLGKYSKKFELMPSDDVMNDLDRVLGGLKEVDLQHNKMFISIASANEDMAQTMDELATSSGTALVTAWQDNDYAARSFGDAVSTVSNNFTKYLGMTKVGISRAEQLQKVHETLAKDQRLSANQQLAAAKAAEQAGKASKFLSENLYVVALGAAAATAALIGLYAIVSKSNELQGELRKSLSDTNLTWSQQDQLMGQLALNAAWTGQSIEEMSETYEALYSQQLAGAKASEDYTKSVGMSTVALGMSGEAASDLAFTYGKVYEGGTKGFEGVASAIKAAGMNTVLTTQEATNLVKKMDILLIRFKEFAKIAVPAALAAGAAMKQSGGDATELIDKMSDMFDQTNFEAQRLKGLLAGTVAGGFGAVSKMMDSKDTTQMLSMLSESLHNVAPTEQQFNAMRGFYARMYGMSEENLAAIYRLDKARLAEMETNKKMLEAAQNSTKPLTEAFDRARTSFSNAFERFMQGFGAILAILGRPFLAVLTVVFNVLAKISFSIAWVASSIQRLVSWFEEIPVIGWVVTGVVTAISLAIGGLIIVLAGLMAYNLAAYLMRTYNIASKLPAIYSGIAKAIGSQRLAELAEANVGVLLNGTMKARYQMIKRSIVILYEDVVAKNLQTIASWQYFDALSATNAANEFANKSAIEQLYLAWGGIKAKIYETAALTKLWVKRFILNNETLRSIFLAKRENMSAKERLMWTLRSTGTLIKETAATIWNTSVRGISLSTIWKQTGAYISNTAATLANAWAQGGLIGVLTTVTGAIAATTGAIWANTVAFLSNPITWIAISLIAVALAFKYLGTTLGFVTLAVIALGIVWYASGIGAIISLIVGVVALIIAGVMLLVKGIMYLVNTFGLLKVILWGLFAPFMAVYSLIKLVYDAIWGHSLGTGLLLLLDVFKAIGSVISGTIVATFQSLASVITVAYQAIMGLAGVGFGGLTGIALGLSALGIGFAAFGFGLAAAVPGIMAFTAAMGIAKLLGLNFGVVIKPETGAQIMPMEGETAKPKGKEKEGANLTDVVNILKDIQKTIADFSQSHEDDELVGMAQTLGWKGA